MIRSLSDQELYNLNFEWPFWARPHQRPPPGDWSTWNIRAGRGWGKALDIKTPIPTPRGWSTMGALRPGDEVFDETGAPCRVVETHPVSIDRLCFRVVFSDGADVIADEDHLWMTIDRRARKSMGRAKAPTFGPNVVTTKQIAKTLMDQGERNHAIPLAGALQCGGGSLLIDPYLLGAWLGDGHSKEAAITSADTEVHEAFIADGWLMTPKKSQNSGAATTWIIGTEEAAAVRCATTGQFVATGVGWLTQIRSLGLYRNKYIPVPYLRAGQADRLALLQGLMDTDGHITPTGHAEYCGTNRALVEGVLELCRTLGIKATMSEGRATLYGRDCGPKYRVKFTPYLPVFRIVRKLRCVKAPGRQAKRQARRYIVAVEPVESVPVRCITVDSPSSLYLCGHAMIPTHNTRTGGGWLHERANEYPGRWMAIIARNPADARDYCIEGPGGLLRNIRPDQRPVFESSKRRVTWPNKSWATIYSDEEPDQLRGFSGDTAWIDELGKYKNAKLTWDNLQMGMREASTDRPRRLITSTPRPIKVLNEIEALPGTITVIGSSYENRGNLDPTWFDETLAIYEGTSYGNQEIYGDILGEAEGALWERGFFTIVDTWPELVRIVVAIDPAATNTANSDETGIVVAGLGINGKGYVLEDLSGRYSPLGWAKVAIAAYHRWEADRIVAEVNNGGDMVETTLRTVDASIPYRAIHASRGKQARAEPIAALYEIKNVNHIKGLGELEDQLVNWEPGSGDKSPDRLDACVWALTELMLEKQGEPRIRRL